MTGMCLLVIIAILSSTCLWKYPPASNLPFSGIHVSFHFFLELGQFPQPFSGVLSLTVLYSELLADIMRKMNLWGTVISHKRIGRIFKRWPSFKSVDKRF